MNDLKLAKLPDRTPVKVSINIMPDLHQALSDYVDIYRQTYGHAEPLGELIPAMLTSFSRAIADLRASERSRPNDHECSGTRLNGADQRQDSPSRALDRAQSLADL